MTASPDEDARAGQAVAAGEQAARDHQADALAEHAAAGSTEAIEPAATPDSHAVDWIPSGDDTAQATLIPSEPPAVNSYDRNPTDPT